MVDEDEVEDNVYPTDDELAFIENFDAIQNDVCVLIRHIRNLWWMPSWGFVYDPVTMDLELHTAGWSGNESIMYALENNKHMFWAFYWVKSVRGGHYWFNLDLYNKTGYHRTVSERIF